METISIAFCLLCSTVILSSKPPSDCVSNDLNLICRRRKCAGTPAFKDCENKVSSYLGGNQCCNQKTLTTLSTKKSKRQFYNFDVNPTAKWNLPISYHVNFSQNKFEQVIGNAIAQIESMTCISFSRGIAEPSLPYIVFNRFSEGCMSFVGKSDKLASPIYGDDSCYGRPGAVMYLIIQTLGLWHQTQRPDAVNYVNILRDNMEQSHWADFVSVSPEYIVTTGYPYDYASITHYAGKVFSKNGQPTIETVDPLYQNTIGQKVELSFQDAKLLNHFYCSNECSTSLICLNGGYPDHKNCSKCICPSGFQGILCELFLVSQSTIFEQNDCGGELIATSNNQTITSPGYEKNIYPSYALCEWKIKAPSNKSISLQFVENFGLYSDEFDACQHWVEIRYRFPYNSTGPRFCGSKLPTVSLNSTSNAVLVIFKSNDMGLTLPLGRGFKLKYKLISENEESCSRNPCQNEGTCIENGESFTCLCGSDYGGDRCQFELKNATYPCYGNPCRNNGTCQVTGNSYKCACMAPFYGDRCHHARCGGCDRTPGLIIDRKCYVGPPDCKKKKMWKHHNHWHNSTSRCVELCCDNAIGVNSKCAALGWTDWSLCSSVCGSGLQIRYKYGIKESAYKIVNTERRNCTNFSCPRKWHPISRWC